MKKSYLLFFVIALVIISLSIWLSLSNTSFSFSEIYQIPIILVLIGFAIFVGVRRFRSEKKGQPGEDELSRQIMQRAASLSYFKSLYLWLVIMYISDKGIIETEILFGWGILGMGVIFGICWVITYWVGFKSE